MSGTSNGAASRRRSVSNVEIEADLWPQSDASLDGEQLFRHYTLYLESAQQISDRRATANSFFLTLNTSAAGLLGILNGAELTVESGMLRIVLLALMILCVAWIITLRSYRTLNSAKFRVIGLMEKRLAAAPFTAEWTALDRGRSIRTHMPLTPTETFVPIAFLALYFVLMFVF